MFQKSYNTMCKKCVVGISIMQVKLATEICPEEKTGKWTHETTKALESTYPVRCINVYV